MQQHLDPHNYQPPAPQVPYGAYPVPLATPAVGTQANAAPHTDPRARNAAIVLAVCGVVMLVGLVSRAWFSTRGGNVGLIGLEECRGALCRGISWFDVKRAPTELKMFSTIGIIGIVGAIAFLLQAAVMLARREAHRVMMVPLNAALGIAAFGCFSFFFHLSFGEMSRKLSTSYAGLLAMGGIIGASIAIGLMVRPLQRAANK
jgi:hypothetical protein